MRLLYVSQYYPPEMGAPAVRVSQLARAWAAQGHSVAVITGFPNHPTGQVHPAYRRRIWGLWCSEEDAGVHVFRTWLWPAANKGRVLRSLNYLSFALSALVRGALLRGKVEWVIGTSPQLLCALAGYLIARVRGLKFCMEVRDLWPESLVALGVARQDSASYRVLSRAADYLYRHADRIVVVTQSFHEDLARRGVPTEKLGMIKNGVNTEVFRPGRSNPELRHRLGLEGCLALGYFGTLGMAHGLETLLEVAASGNDERLRFLLVGEGAEKEKLVETAAQKGLRNAVFLGQVPWEQIPEYLDLCFAVLVSLKKAELFRTVLPSKLFEAMACARPVILAGEGEAAALVRSAEAGLVVPPGDAEALATAVRQLAADPDLCGRMGQNGHRYVSQYHDYPELARKFADLLGAF